MLGKDVDHVAKDVGRNVVVFVRKRFQTEGEELIAVVGVEPGLGVFLDANDHSPEVQGGWLCGAR